LVPTGETRVSMPVRMQVSGEIIVQVRRKNVE
jgi:hypothetical protein